MTRTVYKVVANLYRDSVALMTIAAEVAARDGIAAASLVMATEANLAMLGEAGLLANTSFNVRGEPIVNTPENALDTFSKSGIDTLIMGNYVLDKS